VARLPRQEVEAAVAPERAHDPVSAHERLGPRVLLAAPPEVLSDEDALLRWAAATYPLAIRSEEEVLADRETMAVSVPGS
jgi:hypothetical protein